MTNPYFTDISSQYRVYNCRGTFFIAMIFFIVASDANFITDFINLTPAGFTQLAVVRCTAIDANCIIIVVNGIPRYIRNKIMVSLEERKWVIKKFPSIELSVRHPHTQQSTKKNL